ncbi:MAG: hypothetical protein A2Y62_05215 [Candidatus Fischerbacteria bacterium RBG_13_37_8]|uniref:DNA binding HTH domain-containing protein n=1 Tax=Candidatus Fischerbacteria bacterium RBG_13_37_8 TaxID=1817863 RepID=A0A1F5V8J0_9BACT|nr:MAG: hypothetical protein A2Y62_05215 [Candidatus Fischerbacteria bacterium RBG_13_37_8]
MPDSILSIEKPVLSLENELVEDFDLEATIDIIKKFYILKALKDCNGNQTKAAEVLKISARSIRYYIKKLDIDTAF